MVREFSPLAQRRGDAGSNDDSSSEEEMEEEMGDLDAVDLVWKVTRPRIYVDD